MTSKIELYKIWSKRIERNYQVEFNLDNIDNLSDDEIENLFYNESEKFAENQVTLKEHKQNKYYTKINIEVHINRESKYHFASCQAYIKITIEEQ